MGRSPPWSGGGLRFGASAGIAASAAALIFAARGHRRTASCLMVLGGLLLAVAAVSPRILEPIERGWSSLARAVAGLNEAVAGLLLALVPGRRRPAER